MYSKKITHKLICRGRTHKHLIEIFYCLTNLTKVIFHGDWANSAQQNYVCWPLNYITKRNKKPSPFHSFPWRKNIPRSQVPQFYRWIPISISAWPRDIFFFFISLFHVRVILVCFIISSLRVSCFEFNVPQIKIHNTLTLRIRLIFTNLWGRKLESAVLLF